MTFDYYMAMTIVRLTSCLYLGLTLLRGAHTMFFRAMGGFFLAFGCSMTLFFVRGFLPDEWESVLRISGITVQAVSVFGVAMLCVLRKFD